MFRALRDFWAWLATPPPRTFRSVVEELVAGLRDGSIILDPDGDGDGDHDDDTETHPEDET